MGATAAAAAAVALFLLICVTLQPVVRGSGELGNGYRGLVGQGYRLASVVNNHDESGIVADLVLIKQTEAYGADISNLRLTVR